MRIEDSQTLAVVSRSEIVRVDLSREAEHYVDQSRAPATRRAYLTDTRRFATWCAAQGLTSIPASAGIIANFLSFMAQSGFKVATIERNLAAISVAHRKLGFESPRRHELVREVMRGIRRNLGVAPAKKSPVLVGDLRALVAATAATGTKGTRDRALLTIGFAGAFRRSELVALDIADLSFTSEGLEVTLRRSKTDQEGAGIKVGIPYGGHPQTCPVRLVRAWMDASSISEGPVFRSINRHAQVSSKRLSGKAVATVIKELAAKVGLDARKLGAHSLRAGLATSAIKAGKQERVVMRQTRHKSVAVFRDYVRDADLFRENAAAGIGL